MNEILSILKNPVNPVRSFQTQKRPAMTKRILVILFFALAATLLRGADPWTGARAQRFRAGSAPSKYADFKHATHAGKVKSLTSAGLVVDLDCAYCHGTAIKDKLGVTTSAALVHLAMRQRVIAPAAL